MSPDYSISSRTSCSSPNDFVMSLFHHAVPCSAFTHVSISPYCCIFIFYSFLYSTILFHFHLLLMSLFHHAVPFSSFTHVYSTILFHSHRLLTDLLKPDICLPTPIVICAYFFRRNPLNFSWNLYLVVSMYLVNKSNHVFPFLVLPFPLHMAKALT